MPAYLVVEVVYRDRGWIEAYRQNVPQMIAARGGRYLARAADPALLEGDGPTPNTLAVIEFPTADAARDLLAAPEYQPYLEARQAGAATRIFLIEG